MSKKKSPYRGYTVEEVAKMENGYWNLQFGGDFIIEGDYFLFTKAEVSKLYKKYLKDLADIIEDGSEKDRKYALDLIATMSVKQMRLH